MTRLPPDCLAIVLFGFLLAQQIDSVNLTRPHTPSRAPDKRPIPEGCEKWAGGGIADGWVEPEDHRPREIVVEVVSASDMKPALGSEVEAVVQLWNTDTRPIQIPWSTDPGIVEEGQRPDDLEWEGGTFDFRLNDQQGNQVALKSLTEWLYASKFVKGSQLAIQPGQNISALVKFKLEDLYPTEPLRLKAGEWQLSAKWHQVGRTWHIKNCGAWNGYFHYENFYHQQSPGLTIQITAQDSADDQAK